MIVLNACAKRFAYSRLLTIFRQFNISKIAEPIMEPQVSVLCKKEAATATTINNKKKACVVQLCLCIYINMHTYRDWC